MARGARRRAKRRTRFLSLTIVWLCALGLLWASVYFIGIYPRARQKATYPLAYEALIRENAQAYALDPAHVASVVYCESSFRPDAVSGAGAVGLMQIMPETGEWIAKKLGDTGYTQASLADPATSLRYGCWYLRYLSDRFDGDLTLVTAAYHAGGGTVDQWLSDAAYSSDGQTLSTLPDNATGRYVQKVLEVYEIYKELMNT